MSGYTDKAFTPTNTWEPGTAFLQKPFTPQMLAHKVREMLVVSRTSDTERAA
jgi:hypothetical protein